VYRQNWQEALGKALTALITLSIIGLWTTKAAARLKSRSEIIREAYQRYSERRQPQAVSLTRQMHELSKEERAKVMAAAAETLAEYYRTDPEMQEWQALDSEDFYDLEETIC